MTEVSIDISDPGPDPLPSGSNETEAINLQYIHGNTRLRLILQEWESKLRDSQDIILRKQTLSLNVKNEIYHLIGFFSVFQGVVLTTVSQASLLSCHNWWGPFALSLLASLTTLVGVCHKFWNFISWKRAAEEEIANAKVLKSQIDNLKLLGKRFTFAKHAPDVEPKQDEEKTCSNWLCAVNSYYYYIALLVVVSMLGFSAIILISCRKILCDSGSTA